MFKVLNSYTLPIIQNMIVALLRGSTADPAVQNRIMFDINEKVQNGGSSLGALDTHLANNWSPTDWANGRTPNQEQLKGILVPLLSQWVNTLTQAMMQSGQGGMGMGNMGMGNMGMGHGNGGAFSLTGNAASNNYDAGLGSAASQPPAPQQPQTLPQSPSVDWNNLGAGSGGADAFSLNTPHEEDHAMGDEPIIFKEENWHTAETFKNVLNAHRVLRGTTSHNTQATHITGTMLRTYNDDFEVAREGLACIPGNLRRGRWTFTFTYYKLMVLDISTKRFTELRDKIIAHLNDSEWTVQELATCLDDVSKGEWSLFNKLITDQINQRLKRLMRSTVDIDEYIIVDNIDDVVNILDPEVFVTAPSSNPNYLENLENRVIAPTLTTFFSDDYDAEGRPLVVGLDDQHLGDFIAAKDIKFYTKEHPDISKFDAILLNKIDVKTMMSKMMDEHTVLRIPTTITVTNQVPAVHMHGPMAVNLGTFGVGEGTQAASQVLRDMQISSRTYCVKPSASPAETMRHVLPVVTQEDTLFMAPIGEVLGF